MAADAHRPTFAAFFLSVLIVLVAPFVIASRSIRRRLARRRQRRDNLRLLREQESHDIKLAGYAKTIAAQRDEITRLKESLKQQIEINARDRQRVAWETAHFARRTEQELAAANATKAGRALSGGTASGMAGMNGFMGRNDLESIFNSLGGDE